MRLIQTDTFYLKSKPPSPRGPGSSTSFCGSKICLAENSTTILLSSPKKAAPGR